MTRILSQANSIVPLVLVYSIVIAVFLGLIVTFVQPVVASSSETSSAAVTTTMSGLKRLPPLLLPAPAARHTATVIFFHGLGDTGYGWADAVQNWRRRSKLDEVKFILPHAPQIPITCNGGMRMPGWYDIVALTGAPDDLRRQQDEAGMLVSRAYISGLIQAEIDNGVPADRIVLGGFSQGGAMSLFAGLTTPRKIAGIVGMSSYLPLDAKLPEFLGEGNHNQDTPILMCHGTADNVVPASAGRSSAELLKKTGFDVTWKEYPGMAHSACLEELDDVEAFLASRLPALGEEKRSEL